MTQNETTFYIIRHGQSVANRDRIVSGQLNTPLTNVGRQQAKITAKLLEEVEFNEVYSSHLDRAHETAQIVVGDRELTVTKLPELSERSYGQLEGKPAHEYDQLKAAQSKTYFALSTQERFKTKVIPDMESDHELSERFLAALYDIGRKHSGQTVLIGSHAGPIRTTLIDLGHLTENQMPAGGFSNCGYIKLRYSSGKLEVVEVYNPTTKELGTE